MNDIQPHASPVPTCARSARLLFSSFLCALFLLGSGAGQFANAGEASGHFRAEGGDFSGVISPTHAAAYSTREQYDARRTVIEIVLSGAPVDALAAAAAPNPHIQAINQDALINHDYVLLWLSPEGQLSMNATFGKTMTQFLERSGGALQAEISVNTPERVAGRLFSKKPLTTLGGGRYTVDLKFDTEVSRLPKGLPLKKGGDAPGKALHKFLAAAEAKKWPAIKAGASPAALNSFAASYRSDQENAEYALDLLRMWLPKWSAKTSSASRLKIIGGEQRGDIADLEIEGDMHPGMPALYLARMRKNGALWQFETATLLGLLTPR